jgi:hypothetical protein
MSLPTEQEAKAYTATGMGAISFNVPNVLSNLRTLPEIPPLVKPPRTYTSDPTVTAVWFQRPAGSATTALQVSVKGECFSTLVKEPTTLFIPPVTYSSPPSTQEPKRDRAVPIAATKLHCPDTASNCSILDNVLSPSFPPIAYAISDRSGSPTCSVTGSMQ